MKTKFTAEYIAINGISQYLLHLPQESKDVLLMLHGGPGVPNSYAAHFHAPYLDFCNVVYYDQRGAGKTQIKNKSTPESISLDVLIEDVRQVVFYLKKKYQTERVFLAGHSWGSGLGTQFIARYPQDVAGFIGYGQMTDASITDRHWFLHLKKAVEASGKKRDLKKCGSVNEDYPNIPVDEYVKATATLAGLESKYGFHINKVNRIYRKSPIMGLKDGRQLMELTGGGAMNSKLVSLCHNFNITDLKTYDVPVYYILGRHDEWTASAVAAAYFETITAPKKGLYWIEDAGHMVDTDNPAAFFSTIKEILAQ